MKTKLVIDTNLVFSAILKPDSKISKILQSSVFEFYAPDFLRIEILKYVDKIQVLGNYTEEEFQLQKEFVFRYITFISDSQIRLSTIKKAKELVFDIDPKDFIFIALCEELQCKLWTGDKKLYSGLMEKNYNQIVSSKEIESF